jgi:uncharacterized protein (DUF1499 family)
MGKLTIIGLSILAALAALVLLRLGLLSFLAKAPATLGATDGRLAPCPRRPNCVSSQASASDATHRIDPLATSGARDDAVSKALAALSSMPGGRVVTVDGGYVHAEFTSRIFRFVDDLELLWDTERGVFDVRSASRVGTSDLGVNRRRVEAFRALLGG